MTDILVEPCQNASLEGYLAHDPPANLFPLHVVQRAANGSALRARRGDEVVGAVVSGGSSGVHMVPGSWLVASEPSAANALFEALKVRGLRPELNYPVPYLHLFQRVFPGAPVLFDRYYVLQRPAPPAALRPGLSIVGPDRLGTLDLTDEMRAVVGPPATLPTNRYFALVDGSSVVATVDCILDVGAVTTLQQVYTRSDRRRLGLSMALLSHVCAGLVAQDKIVTYLASGDNVPSLRLAESVGFTLFMCFGYCPAAGADGG
jgi:hypothetical protein